MVTVPNGTWSSAFHDGDLVIELSGEIDCANAPLLHERLSLEIEDVPSNRLIIDMRAVTFIDSGGIRLLIQAKRSIEAAGGTIDVRGLRPQARRTLEVSGVLAMLTDASAS